MRGGKAYAARMAYADEVQLAEAWYEFNTAKDYSGVVQALGMRQLLPQNVMVADYGVDAVSDAARNIDHFLAALGKPVGRLTLATWSFRPRPIRLPLQWPELTSLPGPGRETLQPVRTQTNLVAGGRACAAYRIANSHCESIGFTKGTGMDAH